MKSLAIIPARSGSKGLKDKNIKPLNGRPLIWYSVQAALNSGEFAKVVVSTDSPRYAEIARDCGAEVPFFRSEKLAGDNASSWAVVKEVLDFYRDGGVSFDSVMLLQPTSPLRTADDISEAFRLLARANANAIISVTEMEHSPLWSNVLPPDKSLDNFIPPEYNVARQKLPTYYRYNGAIYLARDTLFDKILDTSEWCGVFAYIMPKDRSIDIDDEFDFLMAEEIMKFRKANGLLQ